MKVSRVARFVGIPMNEAARGPVPLGPGLPPLRPPHRGLRK